MYCTSGLTQHEWEIQSHRKVTFHGIPSKVWILSNTVNTLLWTRAAAKSFFPLRRMFASKTSQMCHICPSLWRQMFLHLFHVSVKYFCTAAVMWWNNNHVSSFYFLFENSVWCVEPLQCDRLCLIVKVNVSMSEVLSWIRNNKDSKRSFFGFW